MFEMTMPNQLSSKSVPSLSLYLKFICVVCRLVELVDLYQDYSFNTLPKLGKHLMLPSNNPKMEISTIVGVIAEWYPQDINIADLDQSQVNNFIYREEIMIPILCSMSI